MALVTAGSVAVATFFAGQASQTPERTYGFEDLGLKNVTAAVSSEKFSIATGPVDIGTEGLFVLDHNSGLLQCSVIYPRLRQFGAIYQVNVAQALGVEAGAGGYIICTGTVDFQRSNQAPIGLSVIYVLDTTTGNYGCFGMPFDRVAMNANRPQQGALILMAQGTANPIIDRDALR